MIFPKQYDKESDYTYSVSGISDLSLKDLESSVNKLRDIKKYSYWGMPVTTSLFMKHGEMAIVNSASDAIKIISAACRKVIFKIWRFELAYFKKES